MSRFLSKHNRSLIPKLCSAPISKTSLFIFILYFIPGLAKNAASRSDRVYSIKRKQTSQLIFMHLHVLCKDYRERTVEVADPSFLSDWKYALNFIKSENIPERLWYLGFEILTIKMNFQNLKNHRTSLLFLIHF